METFSECQAPNVKTVSKRKPLTSLTTPTAGNGGREFPPICAQCGAPATDAAPVQLCAVEGVEYLLHPACQKDWMGEAPPDLSIPTFLQRTPTEEN